MSGSFFHYLSWIGYVGICMAFVALLLICAFMVHVHRGNETTKLERTFQLVGTFFIVLNVAYILTFFDWAYGHGWIVREGVPTLDISEATARMFLYGLIGLFVAYSISFIFAWVIRRRRERRELLRSLRAPTSA